MQVCTSLQTNNHASIPQLSFYRPDDLPAAQPTASKHWRQRNPTYITANRIPHTTIQRLNYHNVHGALLFSPLGCWKQAQWAICFAYVSYLLLYFSHPTIISKPTRPIFTKFSGLLNYGCRWSIWNQLSNSSSDVAMETNFCWFYLIHRTDFHHTSG